MNGMVPDAHACGLQATGYFTGMPYFERVSPPKPTEALRQPIVLERSGRLVHPVNNKDISLMNPYFLKPMAMIALSCGQTVPL
jgi:hypothetical protein